VFLPLGAIEQHGPHLPLLVDWRGAEELARRVAPHLRRAGWRPILAPSIPYGVSTLAVGWPGTVSLSISTLRRLIVELVNGLASHGFRRFVLTNYQADPDHLRAIAAARRALARRRQLRVLVAGFEPATRPPTPMVNRRVQALMRSPNPDAGVALRRAGDLRSCCRSTERWSERESRDGCRRRGSTSAASWRAARATFGSSARAGPVTSAGRRPRERGRAAP
jgi:hypothetical protein